MKTRLKPKPIATPKTKETTPQRLAASEVVYWSITKQPIKGDRCFFKSKITSFQSRLIHLRQGGDSA